MANNIDTEIKAEQIQELLRVFFGNPSKDFKDRNLAVTCTAFTDIDSRILAYLVDTETQSRLVHAIDLTLQTPFQLENEDEVIPWTGGFTVVAMDRYGNIQAAHANPVGDVYKRYGENLYPYALTKTAQRVQITWAGNHQSGLEDPGNYQYIAEIMEGRHVYLGEAMSDSLYTKAVHYRALMLGASGCELSTSYRDLLAPAVFELPHILKDRGMVEAAEIVERETADFVAGYADMVFARQITEYVNYPNKTFEDAKAIPEPKFFSLLRRAH